MCNFDISTRQVYNRFAINFVAVLLVQLLLNGFVTEAQAAASRQSANRYAMLQQQISKQSQASFSALSDDPFADSEQTVADPWEKYNRRIWSFNKKVNRFFFIPLVKVYRGVVFRQEMRDGVANFLRNLDEPMYMVNSLLQADSGKFFNALTRFVVNSTFGIVGFFDFAAAHGVQRQRATFGDTLLHWGGCQCRYVVLPLFGPYTATRAVGLGLDVGLYPVSYVVGSGDNLGLFGLNLLDRGDKMAEGLDDLSRKYIDDYAAVRSAYMQQSGQSARGTGCNCA